MQKSIILALLLACGAAQAADWIPVIKDSDRKAEMLVDVSSIRIAGQIRKAWNKTIFTPPSVLKGKLVSSMVSLTAFNCGEGTYSFQSILFYYADGSNWSTTYSDQEWDAVAPDTNVAAVMNFICAWKPK
jgi:hypothetical protein